MEHVVRLAAEESEGGRARYLAKPARSSADMTDDVMNAARLSSDDAGTWARGLATLDGGAGWMAVPAHLAEAGYDTAGQGVGAGYCLTLSGRQLDGTYGTREKAWAAAAQKEALTAERATLAEKVMETETDAFPGSRAYRAYSAALLALEAFDMAHPEVIAAAQAARSAAVLGGKDIAGL